MMGLFDKIRGPVFLKETGGAPARLMELQELAAQAPPELRTRLEHEVKMLRAGIQGEETIAFELRNSHLPMMVLHDLYLECGELSAQIDYLIVTRGRVFVLECKNLVGNIEINNNGDFIRTVHYGGRPVREGIYSPLTQNRRHLALLRQLRLEAEGNAIARAIQDRRFSEAYRSVVVLANSKTVLEARYAKKEVKQQVIRADQLLAYMERANAEPGAPSMSERQMEELAQFYYSRHRENPTDYTARYREMLASAPSGGRRREAPLPARVPSDQVTCPVCGAPMVMRTAARGANAGRSFYGCTRFPQCRGVVDVEQLQS